MHRILTAALAITSAVLLSAQTKTEGANADTSSVEQSLIQLEKDWNQATLTKDYKTLNRIMADEWTGIDYQGVTVTKAESIAELKSGESGNTSVELGEMKVKVYGNTAVVVGSDTEKSTYHGKDSSGRYAWMDVFVKRGGRWQAVASESTRIGK
jgi:ketosteroid isomerase-like protein